MTPARDPKQLFLRHLGGHLEASGWPGWQWESKLPDAQNIDAPLEPNAKVPLKCQFYEVFLRVGITKYCKLR